MQRTALPLLLGAALAWAGCPAEEPAEEVKTEETEDQEDQEVVTLDAGPSENTTAAADAGSVVPPETPDAGTPTPSPSDAGSNAPQGQWWLDAGLILGCMTDADCTALNGHGTCSADTEGGYNVEVFTGRCKFYEGGTMESTFSYCKLQTEIENCSNCSCSGADAGLVAEEDAGVYIPPFSINLEYLDGGLPIEIPDGGPDDTMNGFSAALAGWSCVAPYARCGAASGPTTCCHGTLETCSTYDGYASCQAKNQAGCDLHKEKNSQGQSVSVYKQCPGTFNNTCCHRTEEICTSSWGVAYCKPKTCNGQWCGSKKSDCCKAGETCVNLGKGFGACSKTQCKASETLCTGKWNRCCPAGTVCSKGGTKNPNCVPKGRTDCKETASFIDGDSGECLCNAVCSQDTEYQSCGDDLCGGSCGTCGEGSSCAEDGTGGICLPDPVEPFDAGLYTPDPEPEPVRDGGMPDYGEGCADGCPDQYLECSDIPGMDLQSVSYQKGECQEQAGTYSYCYYHLASCTSDVCAYGVCDGTNGYGLEY